MLKFKKCIYICEICMYIQIYISASVHNFTVCMKSNDTCFLYRKLKEKKNLNKFLINFIFECVGVKKEKSNVETSKIHICLTYILYLYVL